MAIGRGVLAMRSGGWRNMAGYGGLISLAEGLSRGVESVVCLRIWGGAAAAGDAGWCRVLMACEMGVAG